MALPPDPSEPLPDEPELDVPDGRPLLVLVDASSSLERTLIAAWARRHGPPGTTLDLLDIAPSRRRRPGRRTDPGLAARLHRGDDPWVVPARVVWFPAERRGRRTASWVDVLKLGDPRDPDPLRGRLILARSPERVRIVTGEGASAAALLAAHTQSVEVATLSDFVTRRAHLSLERAERAVRGNRYKVPRFLHEEILSRSEFRDRVLQIAGEQGIPPELAFVKARYYLREIAASHSPFLIDLIANAIHWIYRQGYGAILYDPSKVREIAALGQEHPIAFLPSHRSNMDRLSLQYLLWENDLPPNHTAAGINMNFFPVGPLIRRTGAFFIRRSFKGNELYKHVLRSYLDYLVEKRFPLEWYLEGGRSRSGKLMPPRYGLLGWVVDSVRRGKAEDLHLIPTSIAYDQIQDVGDYAREAQGGDKQKESFTWALGAIKSLRRRYGNIHVRFADPISVTKEVALLAGPPEEDGVDLDLQKLAFEVMYRISRVTPVTPTSLVAIALLADPHATQTVPQITRTCSTLQHHVHRRGLPTTERLHLQDPVQVRSVLEQLARHGSVTRTELDGESVYRLSPGQALQAAYYRNTIVHYFVPRAIAELALLGDRPFWTEVSELRDLFKFEFFFAAREEFVELVEQELEGLDPDSAGPPGLERLSPLTAHWALLPFVEAYLIAADELIAGGHALAPDRFLTACLQRGRAYRDEGRVAADESVSKILFSSALDLARNRGLLETDAEDARARFAAEVAAVRRRALEVARVAALAPV